jgi:hypothetical protein
VKTDSLGVDLRAQLGVADAVEIGAVAALERGIVEVQARGEVARRLAGLDDALPRGARWCVGHVSLRFSPSASTIPVEVGDGPGSGTAST